MKKLKILLTTLIIGSVFFSSCTKRPTKPDYMLDDGAPEIKSLPLECITWYKLGKTGWEVNKSWGLDELDEMVRIKKLLTEPEKPYPYWDVYHKLSLIFYDGNPENLKLWEVEFDIKGKTFTGSVGASQELGELLLKYLKKEDIPVLVIDPNRFKQVEEQMRKRAQELKEQRQAEEKQSEEQPE
jgi:hypothetical protein